MLLTKQPQPLVLPGLLSAMLLAMLDNMIVGTAMPRIVGDLGGLDHLSWVVTAYVLGTTVSTPIWGKLGDLYGRKSVFLTSIVIFLVGSALCGLSQTHGRSSSASGPPGPRRRRPDGRRDGDHRRPGAAPRARPVPGHDRRASWRSRWSPARWPAASSPTTSSWRWAFYVNLPLGALALVLLVAGCTCPSTAPSTASTGWAPACCRSASPRSC